MLYKYLVIALFAGSFSCAAARPELPPISIRLNPRVVVSAPLERLDIEVVIPRDKANRAVCIVVDGPGVYSQSCFPIDGDKEKAVFNTFVVHLDSDGEYGVIAELYTTRKGPDRPEVVARDTVRVGVQSASMVDR